MCFYRFAVIGFDSVRFGRFDFGKTVFAAPASLYCFAAMDCYLNLLELVKRFQQYKRLPIYYLMTISTKLKN